MDEITVNRFMTDDDFFCERFQLPKLFPWQKEVLACQAERIILCKGRQAGWSTFLNVKSLMDAIRNSQHTVIRASAGGRQIGLDIEELSRFIPKSIVKKMASDRILFKNGSTIVAVPPVAETIRGQRPRFFGNKIHGITLMIDEAAYVEKFDAVLRALEYSLLAAPEGRRKMLIGSSPTTASHPFYQLFLEGRVPSGRIQSFHFTSLANPNVKEEDVEYMRLNKPQWEFENEIMGKVLMAETAFFGDTLNACIKDYQLGVVGDDPGVSVLGVDLKKFYSAGKDRHAVCEWTRGGQITRLTWCTTLRHASVEEVAQLIYSRFQSVGHSRIVIESFDSSGVFELLSNKGLPVELVVPTSPRKNEAFTFFHGLMAAGRLEISKDAVDLISEMQSFEYRVSQTGLVSYGHPVGSTLIHDDLVHAAAWGLFGMKSFGYEIPDGAVASFENEFSRLERAGKTGSVRKSNIGYLGNVPGGLTAEEEAFHSKSWRRGDADLGADDVRY